MITIITTMTMIEGRYLARNFSTACGKQEIRGFRSDEE
jgi:hypothetical protein